MVKWSVTKESDVCATIHVPFERKKDWEQWVLVGADRHLDNAHSNHAMQRRHLQEAVDRGAPVVDVGDLFDAMQGKTDRRSSKSSLRDEHKHSWYINSIQRSAYEFFKPYAKNLAVLSEGNHETSIVTHLEFNLHDYLVGELRKTDGSQVVHMGYRGYIRFKFTDAGKATNRYAVVVYFTHGSGGGGEVTKGYIQTNRRAVYLPDANIVMAGHIHERWSGPVVRSRLTQTGEERIDEQWHIQIPTYKDEFTGQSGGFHHEKGRPPKPLGAWWLRFFFDNASARILFDIIAAR